MSSLHQSSKKKVDKLGSVYIRVKKNIHLEGSLFLVVVSGRALLSAGEAVDLFLAHEKC